jgi:cytochrome c oxidase subunit II
VSQRVALRSIAVALLAGVPAACVPSPPTVEGQATASLYSGFLVVAAIVGIVVYGLATWAILRYRAGAGDGLPDQTHGSLRLEAIWTAVPILIVLGLFAATLVVLVRVETVTATPRTEVRVDAFRWGWRASYPQAGVTVSGLRAPGPEIRLPVGEPIRITLGAADVVHAFYVPAFLFKRDAIPGRDSVFEITIQEPGSFGGQCAEFCGTFHARMPFTILALPRAEFDAWLAAQPIGASTSPEPS